MEWLLHLDGPRSAAYNMAKDALCLKRVQAGGPPALRLYRWERLTLSVGRSQAAAREIDLAACRALGVPLVRRITGGRAVLHGTDLTYAVTAPAGLPGFKGGILPVYRALSGVFVRWLRELGCAPQVQQYAGRQRAALASPICFATPSAFEVLVEGRKLVGSAQRLLPGAFLQHGSLPLLPQWELLERLFRGASGAALRDRMTDLETLSLLGPRSLERLQEALVGAFRAELGISFVPAPWDAADEAAVRALEAGYPPLEDEAASRPPGAVPRGPEPAAARPL